MKAVSAILLLAAILLFASCQSTKPNVDFTITEGKSVKRVVGRIPEPSNPLSFVLSIGADALKCIFPAL